MPSNISLKSISHAMQTEIPFIIIWLDIPRDHNQTTSESILRLQSLVPSSQRFQTVEDCYAYFFTSTAEKVILIVHSSTINRKHLYL
jgi:hypothetical protein